MLQLVGTDTKTGETFVKQVNDVGRIMSNAQKLHPKNEKSLIAPKVSEKLGNSLAHHVFFSLKSSRSKLKHRDHSASKQNL